MRVFWASLLVVASAGAGSAQTLSASAPATANNGPPPCQVYQGTCAASKDDAKKAQHAFNRASELKQKRQLDEAYREFEVAAQLAPQDPRYLTAREVARQQAVAQHLQRGNQEMASRHSIEAVAEFAEAARLDPQNEFVQQRLRDSLGEAGGMRLSPRLIDAAEPVEIEPKTGTQNFHFRGDSKQLLQQVAQAFGLSPIMDDSVTSRRVRFDLEGADFTIAMQLACSVTKSFYTPLTEKEILIANDSADNRKAFEKMALRTFYVPGASSPQDFTDLTNLLRTVFDVRLISQQPTKGTITLRAPVPILQAATRFLEGNDPSKPQVLLEVNVYQVGHSYVRKFGLQLPNQFSLFNIPAGALKSLGGQNIQDLINQLISGGQINQGTQQSIAALLAQLQNQQTNPLLQQPLATFGGGITFFGLTLGNVMGDFHLDQSEVRTLEQMTLRASHGGDATLMVGTRFPILNASYAPAFNSSAISKVLGDNSYQAAFPSFSYEDLGVKMKIKPFVHGASDVTMDVDLSIRSLSGNSLNGVPVIANREYKGQITVKDSESAVVAGAVDHTDIKSNGGVAFLGQIPVLNKVTSSNSRQESEDELLVVITPHIVSLPNKDRAPEIWVQPSK